ncbi:MAG TPA: ABC transporter permease [Candidatus Tectomicrobia bacterium]|jgi:peptide/nickel transport system permease protein|nr:ABC transporter permease [Candidatus Tectomicrobia bacterium]
MQRYVIRRLGRTLLALWGVSTIVFIVLRLSGDPAVLLLPQEASTEDVLRLRQDLGLDDPFLVQYLRFLGSSALGDFGESLRHREPAMALVVSHLWATIELSLAAFGIALLVALPTGVLAAVKPNSLYDHAVLTLALLGQSAPTFWIGIMLILTFGLGLRWFPIGGRGSWSHMVLPAITLGAFAMASIARLTRSAMLEVIRLDYINTARAKGLRESRVIWKHALKNAAIPVVTIMGLQFGALLGGAVVTETVFSWPGIGRLAIQGIYNRDYPVVQATVFIAAVFFVVINCVVDLLYTILDPRIRYE